MKLMIDTHAFLWFIMGSSKLSKKARDLVEDTANEKLISIASLWEMAIKIALGKLSFVKPFAELIPQQLNFNGIELLNIEIKHLSIVTTLSFYHRDPFDRLMIAQCITEQLPLLSRDSIFDDYPIKRIW